MTDAIARSGREIIKKGSSSFAAAARLFDPATRDDASMLYAWCRHCDDQIDGQELGHGGAGLDSAVARARLTVLMEKTRAALAGAQLDDDPAFAGFQRVALRHQIPERHALDLLDGFRMDVEEQVYESIEDVLAYCYRVAGVVGVMMAMIMGVRDQPTLRRAADLGLGFQLTNIARDVIEDARRGRVYLPRSWLAQAGVPPDRVAEPDFRDGVFKTTRRLLEAAEPYYESARWGLFCLPVRSAWAIAAARGVYREIGRTIIRAGPQSMERRAVVGAGSKLCQVMLSGAVAVRAATIDRIGTPQRADLWSHF